MVSDAFHKTITLLNKLILSKLNQNVMLYKKNRIKSIEANIKLVRSNNAFDGTNAERKKCCKPWPKKCDMV